MSEEIEKVEDKHIVLQQDAQAYLDAFADFVIEDSGDYEVVGNGLKDIARLSKSVEAGKKTERAPYNKILSAISDKYNPAIKVIDQAKFLLKRKLADYAKLEEEKSRLAMLAAAEAAKEGDFDAAHEASKEITIAPTTKGISHRKTWKFSVSDLSKVPRKYLEIDHFAMNAVCKRAGKVEPEAIPGITFYEDIITTVRS